MSIAIILQAAIAAGFFLIVITVFTLVAGTLVAWSYFASKAKGRRPRGSVSILLIRLIKSIAIALIIVFILFMLLLLWNPRID